MNYSERRTAESAVKLVESEPDERLLIEAAKLERSRFSHLYEANFGRVYAFFARRVATREEAEDLTGEVFHQALASLRSFTWQGTPFIAWLYGIAANVLSARWQKMGRNPDQLAKGWDPGGSEEIERRAILAELVDALPADQRRVVIQRFVQQKSIREIATQLGRSEGAVKQLQLRALENLRAKLGRPV